MKSPPTVRHLASILVLGIPLVFAATTLEAQVYIPGGTSGITSISGSNVGIGTNSPDADFDIVGALYSAQPALGVLGWPDDEDVANVFLYGRATTAGVLHVSAGGNSPAGNSNILVLTPDGPTVAPVMVVSRAGRLGLGTASPDSVFHLKTDTAGSSVHIADGGYTGGMYLGASGSNSAGSIGFGAQYVSGSWTARDTAAALINANASSGIAFRVLAGTSLTSGSAFTPTELLRVGTDGNVGIGTASPSHKLAVNGTIRAKEILVDTGWADHVFADDYRLAPLSAVEAHIQENGHLPGIPSAKEVAKQGISVGEMQAKLLEKIEELTLHQIAQDKRLRALEEENVSLKQRLEQPR